MKVTILYFAKLKAIRGLSVEEVDTGCRTVGELYASIGLDGPVGMPRDQVKPAINEVFCDYNRELKEGDVIAFMPPMSGG